MTEPSSENELPLAQRLRRIRLLGERAARMNLADAGFLHLEAAAIIGERLAATNRGFTSPVLLFEGPFSNSIGEAMIAAGAPLECPLHHLAWPETAADRDLPVLDLEPGSVDLAISVFDLARLANLPALLLQLNQALKPDGLLIMCIPGAGTLHELHQALLQAESAATGGAAMRVAAFPDPRQAGDLLQRCGFKLVVTDMEERKIAYRDLASLLRDIRATASASIATAATPALSRAVFCQLKDMVGKQDSGDRFTVSVSMIFASGWKHDPGQQQPLKPGSASNRLGDFL